MKILIATDGSECSEAAIEEYLRLVPKSRATEIKVVSSVEEPYALMGETFGGLSPQVVQELYDGSMKLAERFCEAAEKLIGGRAVVSSEVRTGSAEKAIIDAAREWKPDMIVVGSHGRGFFGRMLGSVSDAVVHDANCPVLIARPQCHPEANSQ